jgi:hypothetical protein
MSPIPVARRDLRAAEAHLAAGSEARIGQQDALTRVCAKRGSRLARPPRPGARQ